MWRNGQSSGHFINGCISDWGVLGNELDDENYKGYQGDYRVFTAYHRVKDLVRRRYDCSEVFKINANEEMQV